jgi:hypothetical protein
LCFITFFLLDEIKKDLPRRDAGFQILLLCLTNTNLTIQRSFVLLEYIGQYIHSLLEMVWSRCMHYGFIVRFVAAVQTRNGCHGG